MARRGETLSVSLFPFLAVLVCVMGALILLLIVTTRKVRQVAIANALAAEAVEVATAPPFLELPDEPELPLPQIDPPAEITLEPVPRRPSDEELAEELALRQQEQALRRQLAELQQQSQLADDETNVIADRWRSEQEQLQALRDELSQLEQELLELHQADAGDDKLISLDQQREQLEAQACQLRGRLKQIEDQPEPPTAEFLVVPFDPKHGTGRRLIYLECREDGIYFLAEGIRLSPADFNGFDDRFNPLAAGVQAVYDYLLTTNPVQGAAREPYVLLLVRPRGTVGYYVAQRMLSRTKLANGYELLPDDLPLASPPADPRSRELCQQAIDETMALRETFQGARSGGGPGIGTGSGSSKSTRSNIGPILEEGDGFLMSQAAPDYQAERQPASGERSWERPEAFERRELQAARLKGKGGSAQPNPDEVPALRSGTGPRRTPAEIPPSPSADRANGTGARPPASRGSSSLSDATFADDLPPSPNDEATPEESPLVNRAKSSVSEKPTPRTSSSKTTPSERSSSDSAADDSTSSGEQPELTFDASPQKRKAARSGDLPLERLNRRKWGQYDPGAAIGFEQTVVIQAWEDRLVIRNQTIPASLQDDREELIQRLLVAIDTESRTWGKPPKGFFWIPGIQFEVHPGGELHVERLEPLFKKAGLTTSRKLIGGSVPTPRTPPATASGAVEARIVGDNSNELPRTAPAEPRPRTAQAPEPPSSGRQRWWRRSEKR